MKIDELLAKLPKALVSAKAFSVQGPSVASHEDHAEFRGLIISSDETQILLDVGDIRFAIRKEDIAEAALDSSQPSPDQGSQTSVVLKVKRSATVEEIKSVPVASMGSGVGLRPFAFAVGSQAAEYGTSAPHAMTRITVERTPHVTTVTTPRATGTEMDYSTDSLNDNPIDQRVDQSSFAENEVDIESQHVGDSLVTTGLSPALTCPTPRSTPRRTPYGTIFPTGQRPDHTTDISNDPQMDVSEDCA